MLNTAITLLPEGVEAPFIRLLGMLNTAITLLLFLRPFKIASLLGMLNTAITLLKYMCQYENVLFARYAEYGYYFTVPKPFVID